MTGTTCQSALLEFKQLGILYQLEILSEGIGREGIELFAGLIGGVFQAHS
jgi:hypothetical protein